LKRKEEQTWAFDVAYKLPESPQGSVDGAIHGEAKTRDEYYDKAKVAIDTLLRKGMVVVSVLLVYTNKYTCEQTPDEFSNSYWSVQGSAQKQGDAKE
jgi:hypothetical protein